MTLVAAVLSIPLTWVMRFTFRSVNPIIPMFNAQSTTIRKDIPLTSLLSIAFLLSDICLTLSFNLFYNLIKFFFVYGMGMTH